MVLTCLLQSDNLKGKSLYSTVLKRNKFTYKMMWMKRIRNKIWKERRFKHLLFSSFFNIILSIIFWRCALLCSRIDVISIIWCSICDRFFGKDFLGLMISILQSLFSWCISLILVGFETHCLAVHTEEYPGT